jgi:hypothetical protein
MHRYHELLHEKTTLNETGYSTATIIMRLKDTKHVKNT